MKRFNVESLSAEEALLRSEQAMSRLFGGRAIRAQSLLLHWWAAGHDKSRHVLACDRCKGIER